MSEDTNNIRRELGSKVQRTQSSTHSTYRSSIFHKIVVPGSTWYNLVTCEFDRLYVSCEFGGLSTTSLETTAVEVKNCCSKLNYTWYEHTRYICINRKFLVCCEPSSAFLRRTSEPFSRGNATRCTSRPDPSSSCSTTRPLRRLLCPGRPRPCSRGVPAGLAVFVCLPKIC